MSYLQNRTYGEIEIGQQASYKKTISERDVVLFAELSGDINPLHLDESYAESTIFQGRVAHGMHIGALVSAAIALELPGPGSIYLSQTLSFRRPVKIGDTITILLQVEDKFIEINEKGYKKHIVVLACSAVNQVEKIVLKGEAQVLAPTESLTLVAPSTPCISIGESY